MHQLAGEQQQQRHDRHCPTPVAAWWIAQGGIGIEFLYGGRGFELWFGLRFRLPGNVPQALAHFCSLRCSSVCV